MKKGKVDGWDDFKGCWYIGDNHTVKTTDTRAIFCLSDIHNIFPSLKTRDRVKVKITKRARPHAIKLTLTQGYDNSVCLVQTIKLEYYGYRPLPLASRWLNKMAGLTYSGQYKSIWVSFETIKD